MPAGGHRLAAAGLGLLFLAAGTARAELPRHEAITRAALPSWIAGVEYPLEAGGEDAGHEVSYLLVDRQVRIPAAGEPETFAQFVYRIESRSALENRSSWQIDFDPSFQRVTFHDLQVYRDGVWRDRLQPSRASLLHREEDLNRQIFDQRLSLLIVLDDVRVGDTLSIAYTVTGANPVFGNRFIGRFALGWSDPVARAHLRILAATGRRLHFKLHGPSTAEPETRPAAAWTETVWSAADVETIEREADTPEGWVQFPFVQVSEFETWRDVVDWALPFYRTGDFYRTDDAGAPELAEIAARLDRGTPAEKLVAARDWVQENVRYFAVLLGEHSHRPHRPAEVLRWRYGDCKDKSLLLVDLLGSLGIDAHPVLVSSTQRGRVRDWWPSPAAFDHLIVVAEIDGEEVWIDPTESLQGGHAGDLFVPDYRQGLVVRSGRGELSTLPAAQSHPGTSIASYGYTIPAEGSPSEVTIVTRYERRLAEDMRHTLAGTPADEMLDNYVSFYGTDEISLEPLADLEISDDRQLNQMSVTERYRQTYEPAGDEDTVLFSILPLLMEADLPAPEPDRRQPLALPHPLHRRETVRLRAEDPSWEFEPIEESEKHPWFELTGTSEKLEQGLEITYELETLVEVVPPGELEAYDEARQRAASVFGYEVRSEPGLEPVELRRLVIASLGGAALAVVLIYGGFFLALRRLGMIGS